MILSSGGHTYEPKGNNFYYKPEIVYKYFIKSLKMCSYQFPTLFLISGYHTETDEVFLGTWGKCDCAQLITCNVS